MTDKDRIIFHTRLFFKSFEEVYNTRFPNYNKQDVSNYAIRTLLKELNNTICTYDERAAIVQLVVGGINADSFDTLDEWLSDTYDKMNNIEELTNKEFLYNIIHYYVRSCCLSLNDRAVNAIMPVIALSEENDETEVTDFADAYDWAIAFLTKSADFRSHFTGFLSDFVQGMLYAKENYCIDYHDNYTDEELNNGIDERFDNYLDCARQTDGLLSELKEEALQLYKDADKQSNLHRELAKILGK